MKCLQISNGSYKLSTLTNDEVINLAESLMLSTSRASANHLMDLWFEDCLVKFKNETIAIEKLNYLRALEIIISNRGCAYFKSTKDFFLFGS